MQPEILGEISDIEVLVTGAGFREIARLRKVYGQGHWRRCEGIALVRLHDGSIHVAEVHWYAQAVGIRRKEVKVKPPALKARTMTKSLAKQLVVCIDNEGYPASLEKCKIYIALSDAAAKRRGLLRVVDESGEDYLYPKTCFRSIALPQSVKKAMLAAA